MVPWFLCLVLVGIHVAPLAAADAEQEREMVLHVSPFGKDEAAGDASSPLANPAAVLGRLPAIAREKPAAKVRVLLAGGVYRLDAPLTIDRRHVPAQGSLTFASREGEKAIFSGGRRIDGWKVEKDGSWSILLPETASGKWTFRELFVNGERRPRARHPDAGFLRIDKALDDKRSGFTFREGDLPGAWTSGGELVFLHDWSTSRIVVREVAHDTRRLTTRFPIGNRAPHYQIDHFEPHPRYWVEGHRAFLDAPGEWLLDEEGRLSYRPLPAEAPEKTEVVAPWIEALAVVAGDDAGPVRQVHFEGIEFAHCGWRLPASGYAGSQATAHENRENTARGRNLIPAAIQFERAEDCSFTRGRIAHLGGSGIQFGSRTARCRLEDSIIEDVSGNGVNLGEDTSRTVKGRPWWQAAPDQAAAGHVVRHNLVVRCGQQFLGAVAVWAGLARELEITDNEIAWHPYTGVSLGWMWNPTPTPAGANLVARNHIHHVMQVLSDGGGIYTLGRQPGTRLLDNLIHDVPLNLGRAESNGMFLDEGSDQLEIAGNTIYGVVRAPLRFHKAAELTVRNNTLVIPNRETTPLRYNNTRPETIRQEGNRVVIQAEFDLAKVRPPAVGPRADIARGRVR